MNANLRRLEFDIGHVKTDDKGDTPAIFVPRIIEELRRSWIQVSRLEGGQQVPYYIPRLRSTSDPSWMLEIVIHYTTTTHGKDVEARSISFTMLTHTMYVKGFLSSKFGIYYELREGTDIEQLINGSVPLSLNGSYTGGNSIGKAAQEHDTYGNELEPFRDRVIVNRERTFFYLDHLYYYRGLDSQKTAVARGLVYCIQLFAEAVRFKVIEEFISEQWVKPFNREAEEALEKEEKGSIRSTSNIARRFTEDMVNLINDWETLSKEPQRRIPKTDNVHKLGIAKFYTAAEADSGISRSEKVQEQDKRRRDVQGKGKGKGKGKAYQQ